MSTRSMETAHFVAVYVDGERIPKNPGGVPVWGFLLLRDGAPVETKGGIAAKAITNATKHFAEYHAFTNALKEIMRRGWSQDKVVVYTDSQLIQDQLMKGLKVGPLFIQLHKKAKELMRFFSNIEIRHIPRALNRVAHRASKAAYDETRLSQLDKSTK